MGKPLVALSAVHDIFARDHAGIAACSKLIRDALEKEPNLSDVERAISPSEIHPCMETAALRWIGLTANDSVLEMLVRYPRFALYRLLQQQWTMAAKGEPLHPYVRAVGAGFVIASPEFLDLVAETLGQLYWIARDCQRCVEFFEIERQMWAEASSAGEVVVSVRTGAQSTPMSDPRTMLTMRHVRGTTFTCGVSL